MEKEHPEQVWDMFLSNISQSDGMSTEMFDLLSKSKISRLDEKAGRC